ncbi:MAG: cytochrome ubiquinol oxidase subunit I [Burkholderiales bacterium]|nr:cytochrome ubiquinol oxidase subunit I [Burkholderiales bacterium]
MDDPLLLARAQFGLNIAFHILFPSLTIALAWILLGFRVAYHRTGDAGWLKTYRLWTKIFALTFAMGVVTGIVMSFQFGTNWPGFMNRVGAIAGPLLGYEVLTAFFLEATFLGVMLFGRTRVPVWLHTLSTVLVAIGTTASAFWILALNSWMQTPQGFEVIDGTLHVTDWWTVIFNPSFPYRLTHMLLASGLTASFLIAGISALQLLRRREYEPAQHMFRLGAGTAAVLIPLQIVVGDLHGLNTLQHQPAKIAAMEGIWESGSNIPLVLFGWPNAAQQRNDYALEIPGGASWILRHDTQAELEGLDRFADRHPPVAPVFFAFRVMVGIGVLMLLSSWAASAFLLTRRTIPRWMLHVFAAMTFSGWVATISGWLVTEIGRQPYLVYGVLTTAEAASSVPAQDIALTFVGYCIMYTILLVSYLVVLTQLSRAATGDASAIPASGESQPTGPVAI